MKEHFESPFDSDAEAREVIDTSERMQGSHLRDWHQPEEWTEQFELIDPPQGPFIIGLDGDYSLAELLALIHFHPELVKRRAVVRPEAKSDEVRVLELATQKLTEMLNELLEDCTEGQIVDAPSRKLYMKARGCLPAGYSMSLTKKESV
jgi:hypothetical protein